MTRRVLFRPYSAVAATLRKQGEALAQLVRPKGLLTRIHEIFILRALATSPNQVRVDAIETPIYIAAGYGGKDGTTNYYTPGALVEYANGLSALMRNTLRIEDGHILPNIPDDHFKIYLPRGSGILSVGDLPAWSAERWALNNTTSMVHNSSTAVMVAVCPDLEVGEHPPYRRSYMLCRMNGTMVGGQYLGNANETVPANPPPLPGHPALNSEPMTSRPNSMDGIEFSREMFGLASDEHFGLAWNPLEWSYALGVAPALVERFDLTPPLYPLAETNLLFAAYRVSQVEGGHVASIDWLSRLTNADIPSAGQSETLPALTDVETGYVFPVWANDHLVMEARPSSMPAVTFRDPNASGVLFAQGLGHSEVRQPLLAVIEVDAAFNGPNVSVRGYKGSDGTSITVNRPYNNPRHLSTYVLSVDTAGAISLAFLHDYRFDRYDTSTPLEQLRTSSFTGVTTAPNTEHPFGEPRLFCAQYRLQYELVPAEPDGPGPSFTQGEPAHLQQANLAYASKPDEQSWCFFDGSGNRTPINFGAYFPLLLDVNSYLVEDDRRIWFGTDALFEQTQRVGNNYPKPACQFAPGYMACLVGPRSQFATDFVSIRVAIINVAAGNIVALSNPLFTSYMQASYALTCMEQGTLTEDGHLASYGKLIMGVTTMLTGPDRQEGYYTITNLNELSWFAREPSNTIPLYGGNALVPADMGVSARLSGVRPTPL